MTNREKDQSYRDEITVLKSLVEISSSLEAVEALHTVSFAYMDWQNQVYDEHEILTAKVVELEQKLASLQPLLDLIRCTPTGCEIFVERLDELIPEGL